MEGRTSSGGSWWKTIFHQWLLLMKKNFILTKRRRFMAALQFSSPLLFTFILFIVQLFVDQSFQKLPSSTKVLVSSPKVVLPIPRCFHPFNEPNKPCWTLAYAPTNNITDLLMRRVAESNGLTYDHDVIGFVSADDMDDYILNNPNTTQAGYLFLQYTSRFEYSIMFNDTEICKNTLIEFCKDFVYDVALPMNIAMDKEILRYQRDLLGGSSSSSGPDLDYVWAVGQLPQPQRDVYNASQWIGAIFMFAAIMFNFVILLRTMVLEKELRLKEGMKMMGLKEFSYWASWFAFYNVVMLQCVLMLVVSGYVFSLDLITKNSFPVYFVELMAFAESMICFAFLLESLLSKSQSSATIAFVFWVVMCAAITPVNQLIYVSSTPVWVLNLVSLLSPLTFSKGISDLAQAGVMGGISWSDVNNFSNVFPVGKGYYFLLGDAALYFLLAWYISNVFPGEFGVPKPFYFFVLPSYWLRTHSKPRRPAERTPLLSAGDGSTHQTRQQVVDDDAAVVLSELVKSFRVGGFGCKAAGYFHAVKGVSLNMQNNQLFCMLGPNGAGKTTIISMLTGLFPATSGDAVIFGNSISHDMDKIRRVMGVCPQHDLLWNDMTAREHLEFFCRFKRNISHQEAQDEIRERLVEVGLEDVADVPVAAFSGGEKRRLSVALALCGNPKIVFLDEPTTGMDPVSRHQVWEIIQNAKSGRVVILTTHSMEEADVLSDKIAIITHGELRCMGTSIFLKNEYGTGYQLNVYIDDKSRSNDVITFCLQAIAGIVVAHATPDCVTFNVPKSVSASFPPFLRHLEAHVQSLSISDITVNLSSLEEVFLKIAGEADADSDATNANFVALNNNIVVSVNEVIKDGASRDKDARTPFFAQFDALFRKTLSSQKMKWSTILTQLIIPILIVAVMYASGIQSATEIPNNPNPNSYPPPFDRYNPLPPLIFPYVSLTGDALGTCCQPGNSTGFLGNVTLSVLNSTVSGSDSLGTRYPTSAFQFEPFSSKVALDGYLFQTFHDGWLAAYLFESLNFTNVNVALLHNLQDDYATIGFVNIISNSLLRQFANSSDITLSVRVRQFPTAAHSYKPPPMNIEETWCVLGLSFYMAIILSSIVSEKEHRQRHIMSMAGLRISVYWTVLFIVHLAVYLLAATVFVIPSIILGIRFFTLNSPAIFVLAFLAFCFSQVAMAFFISAFCSSAHSASLSAYVYIVTMALMGTYINPTWAQFGAPNSTLYITALIPHLAFGRIVSYAVNYFFPEGLGMTWDVMTSIAPMWTMYFYLLAEGLLFLLFHQYFEHVLPSEYGVPLSPIFFLKKSFWFPSRVAASSMAASSGSLSRLSFGSHENISTNEPADVAAERVSAKVTQDVPVQVLGITKIFKGIAGSKRKRAVNNLAFNVAFGECFGLIGPNGGGKTTLMNVLSGLYPATRGQAFICGFSISENLTDVQRYIGVCPQDSILWEELTGRQHLLYFGRLRGLSGPRLELAVDQILYQVMLVDAQHRPSGGYSGGMKRRLSLAIALIGNPAVVMLDEPTTGVDPFSKRVVWDVIRAYKQHCTILLTTHSMEEAEFLCDRVCMLVSGTMRCIGKPNELKTRYGAGYNLTISHKGRISDIEKFVKAIVPDVQLLDDLAETVIFSLPKQTVSTIGLSKIFESIQNGKEPLRISDWGILQSSLADVLLKVVHHEGGGVGSQTLLHAAAAGSSYVP